MIDRNTARANRLLAALPAPALARWLPHLEEAELPLGRVLREAGEPMAHAVFPTTAIVCLVGMSLLSAVIGGAAASSSGGSA